MAKKPKGKAPKEEEAEDGEEKPAKKGGKKFVVILIAALFVSGGLFGGAYYMGLVHKVMGWKHANKEAALSIGKPVMHELPQIKVDLKTGECRSPLLRTIVQVQLAPEDLKRLTEAQDQIMDAVMTHLRDQERQSVVGKEGAERLRFDLVQIIDNVIRPAKVHTVLFKEFIVQ